MIDHTNKLKKVTKLNEDQYWERIKNRLLSKRNIDGNGCWNFTGNKGRSGYGTMKAGYPNEKVRRVPRISAKIYLGFNYDNQDQFVCHHCDNPSCFNPEHLFIGTNSSNQIDAMKKGRRKYKLVENDIIEIRNLLKTGISKRELSKKYSIARSAIIRISQGKSWGHVQ